MRSLSVVYHCESEKQEMQKRPHARLAEQGEGVCFTETLTVIKLVQATWGSSQAQQGIWTVIKLLSLAIKDTTESFQPI